MEWRSRQDINIQNPNAGNGGDLVKHTVYLATIHYLMAQQPWKQNIRVRECHAGRGIYRLQAGHHWRHVLSSLLSTPRLVDPVLLRDTQRAILEALRCWPDVSDKVEWYAGSALMNACALAQDKAGSRMLDLYEYEPDTRRVLRSVLDMGTIAEGIQVNVLPESEDGVLFDGERHVESTMCAWTKGDLILLDPFAKWRRQEHQSFRNVYAAIIEALLHRGPDAPSLIMFWTWGSAAVVAREDLQGSGPAVRNGYQDLLAKVQRAGSQIVLVKWFWGYQFAMWIMVPTEHVRPLSDQVRRHCSVLSNHLCLNGHRWEHPEIEVEIV